MGITNTLILVISFFFGSKFAFSSTIVDHTGKLTVIGNSSFVDQDYKKEDVFANFLQDASRGISNTEKPEVLDLSFIEDQEQAIAESEEFEITAETLSTLEVAEALIQADKMAKTDAEKVAVNKKEIKKDKVYSLKMSYEDLNKAYCDQKSTIEDLTQKVTLLQQSVTGDLNAQMQMLTQLMIMNQVSQLSHNSYAYEDAVPMRHVQIAQNYQQPYGLNMSSLNDIFSAERAPIAYNYQTSALQAGVQSQALLATNNNIKFNTNYMFNAPSTFQAPVQMNPYIFGRVSNQPRTNSLAAVSGPAPIALEQSAVLSPANISNQSSSIEIN